VNYLTARYAQLVQMSYVTRDMDAAVAHAQGALGIAEFHCSESEIAVLSFGLPCKLCIKAAIANLGSRQFEIIEPVGGATQIYTDAVDLSRHILNFHHVGIAVPGPYAEWERLLEEVRASGDALAFQFPPEPSPQARLCFCYADTRARLGHYTEFLWADATLKGIPVAPWL